MPRIEWYKERSAGINEVALLPAFLETKENTYRRRIRQSSGETNTPVSSTVVKS